MSRLILLQVKFITDNFMIILEHEYYMHQKCKFQIMLAMKVTPSELPNKH